MAGVVEQKAIEVALAMVDEDGDCCFDFYKVVNNFNSTTSLSNTSLVLEACTDVNQLKVSIRFSSLFKVPTASLVVDKTIEFLQNCTSKSWPLHLEDKDRSEAKIFMDIMSNIFIHLSADILLERQYRLILSSKTVRVGDLGIGGKNTWHGTPDGRVRGVVAIVAGDDATEEDSDTDSNSSDGKTIVLEAKRRCKSVHTSQVVATCVVSSFTEKNLYPTKYAMVPTILIGEEKCRVCLYDCEKDILLLSGQIPLSEDGHLSQTAMVFLWAVLNFRDFLQEIPAGTYTAGIRGKLEVDGRLTEFTSLCSKNISWPRESRPHSIPYEACGRVFINTTEPCSKKRRTE